MLMREMVLCNQTEREMKKRDRQNTTEDGERGRGKGIEVLLSGARDFFDGR